MKVAIFTETYFPFISGVVTHIKTLKESLEHAGHEVLIVTTSPKAVCHYVKDGVLYCPPSPSNAFTGMDCPTLSTSSACASFRILTRTSFISTPSSAWVSLRSLPRAS